MPVKIGNRVFKNVDEWQVRYIKKYSDRKLKDIGKEINLDERRVGEIIKLLRIPRERHWKIYLPKTPEVEEELKNPYCIDVHGEWAHSKEKILERDERKKSYFEMHSFNYLVIYEKELQHQERVIEKIKQFTLGFPC